MILYRVAASLSTIGKPRASGDDPQVTAAEDAWVT